MSRVIYDRAIGLLFLALFSMGMLIGCTTRTGPIIFGSAADPETEFRLDGETEIAWTAFLAEPAEETSVNLVISPSGSDSELFGFRQFITDPQATTLENAMTLGRFLRDPGVYVMRYVSIGGQVLAEGTFELTDDAD